MFRSLRTLGTVLAALVLALSVSKVLPGDLVTGSMMTVASAEPTGAPGPTGSPGSSGSEFRPPDAPSQPQWEGSRGYPGLDQNGGVDINNSARSDGNDAAPSQGNPAQPGQSWDRAANGEQNPPDRPPLEYTQAPNRPNPDYRPPQETPQQLGENNSQPQNDQSEKDTAQRENGKNNDPTDCFRGANALLMGQPLPDFEALYTLPYSSVTGSPGQRSIAFDVSALEGRQLDAAKAAIGAWQAAQQAVSIQEAAGPGAVKIVAAELGLKDERGKDMYIGAYKNWSNTIELNTSFLPIYSQDQIVSNLVHEMGHALGLAHSCVSAVMDAGLGPNNPKVPTLMDVAAIRQRWS